MTAQRKRTPYPSAKWDVWELVNRLAVAGWGDDFAVPYFRAARMVLRELSTVMHTRKRGLRGTIDITGPQLADLTGYCEKTVRKGLTMLEDLGLIEWWRGGIVEGAPRPSLVRVCKKQLAAFVWAARKWHEKVLDNRVAAVKARILATVKYRKCKGRDPRVKLHAEVANVLLFSKEAGGVSTPPAASQADARPAETPNPQTPIEEPPMPRPDYMRYLPIICHHDKPAPDRCPQCRYEAIMRKQRADEANQAAAARRRHEEQEAQKMEGPGAWPPRIRAYMQSNYPDANTHAWARLILSDPEAKAIQLAEMREVDRG
ncbi:hypothetical protein HMPREF1317_1562 [Schaalia georgiae F0490]|uniref:Uncharacterized protein n=1 Tax=Schaalia georgiae F0490 TaxID=1125717 RepID=J1HZ96_9ACTO|nr:hypothetical protein [Schaalia georgiae]EJF51690.1 hypothetical protein HMPREF1317_1562 [Schaalia georgiae F0490]